MLRPNMSATEFKQQFQSDPHEYIASHTLQFHVVVDGQCGKVASSGAIISVDGKRYVVTVLHGLSENVGMLCIERKSNRTLIVMPENYPVITSNKLMDDGKRGDPLVDFTFFPLSDDYIPIRKVRFECPDRTRCFRIKELPVCKINALPKEADYSLGGSIPNSDSDADSFALFAEITGLSPIK